MTGVQTCALPIYIDTGGTLVTGSDTPRNAPCPCGSGKKYKRCHGAA